MSLNIKEENTLIEQLSYLRHQNIKLENEVASLNEKMNSYHENIIETHEEFVQNLDKNFKELKKELKIKTSDLDRELEKNNYLKDQLRSKDKELNRKTIEFRKEKAKLINKINDLEDKLTIKNNQNDLLNKYKSLNSVDFSQLCDEFSVDSDEYMPSRKRTFNNQTNSDTNSNIKKRLHSITTKNIKSSSKPTVNSDDSDQDNEEIIPEDNVFKVTFNCKIEYLLNGSSIWKSFPPKKFAKSSSYAYLRKKEMNKMQRKECETLDEFLDYLIIKHHMIKTRPKAIFKTATGYLIRRFCCACQSTWSLYLNIENGEGELVTNLKCKHTLSQNEANECLKKITTEVSDQNESDLRKSLRQFLNDIKVEEESNVEEIKLD